MKDFLDCGTCPVRNVLSRIGDKWSMLILSTLHANGTMRFGEIHKSIGDISHRMLSVTLRSLEEDGLIVRKTYAEVPPRVEYTLTDMGLSLIPRLDSLVEWAMSNYENITVSRERKNSCCSQ